MTRIMYLAHDLHSAGTNCKPWYCCVLLYSENRTMTVADTLPAMMDNPYKNSHTIHNTPPTIPGYLGSVEKDYS